MKARITSAGPCKLNRGELRRVPQQHTEWPIGYHVCCPRCGFVTLALNNRSGLQITESMDGHVSLSAPIRCLYCKVIIHIQRCELTLEEDKDVRDIRCR